MDEGGFEPPASSLRARKINSQDAVLQPLASDEGAFKWVLGVQTVCEIHFCIRAPTGKTARPAKEGNYDVQSFLGSGAGSSCTVAPENLEISERMCLILVS